MSRSAVTIIIPERFCGLRVLLVEPDRKSIQQHANVLQLNSYQVTITTEASNGLSMIMNGDTFDCVLIDADLCETDMDTFLHQVLRHQPQMSIVLMASFDTHLRIPRESLENSAVLCLLKPCCFTDICNIWKHICRNRISSEENVSKEKLHKQDQVGNNVLRVDPRVEPSEINSSTATNNNISSGNFTDHQAIGINSQEHDAMYKHVTYGDLFPEDDGGGDGDGDDVDNRKQPLTRKRKYDQPLEDDHKHPKKRKEIRTRITWKGELENKFQNALKELGEQATSKEILKHMNVPGLTRFHVASHQQKHRNKLKSLEDNIAALAQRVTNFQVESFVNERFRHSIQSDENASVNKSSSLLRLPALNLKGILYMLIENIRAILQRKAPSLPAPQPTTTPNNNYGGDKASDHSFEVVENSNCGGQGSTDIDQLIGHDYGNAMEPMVTGETSSHHAFGEEMAPLGGDNYGGDQATDHSFEVVENSNGVGQGTDIDQLIGHDYENAMEPMVAGETSSHHAFGEAMAPLGGDNYGGNQVPDHSFGVVENSNGGHDYGNAMDQLIGHDYGNAMEPMVTAETSSHHAFGEAMPPLGGDNYGGNKATDHSFLVVENFNGGGQGIDIDQLIGHDYGNAKEPMVTAETSSHHAFGEAMPPLGGDNYGGNKATDHSFPVVENSNGGGQGTDIDQLIGHDYGNAMEPQVTGEISSHHAFGEAMAPLGGDQATDHNFVVVENSNGGGQGTDIQLTGHDYGNAMGPQVTGDISSHHVFGETMAPLGVGATVASDNNLGINFNRLVNGVDNGIFGDAIGSGLSEVQVQLPCFGPAPGPWVSNFGGIEAILNHSQEDLDLPDSFDAEGLFPSQDFQVHRENLGPVSPHSATLFNVENCINPSSNQDSIPFGPASADFSIPEFPNEENDNVAQIQLPVNSIVPLDGSEARFIDDDPSESELEITLRLLNGDDGNLFDGQFYF